MWLHLTLAAGVVVALTAPLVAAARTFAAISAREVHERKELNAQVRSVLQHYL